MKAAMMQTKRWMIALVATLALLMATMPAYTGTASADSQRCTAKNVKTLEILTFDCTQLDVDVGDVIVFNGDTVVIIKIDVLDDDGKKKKDHY